MKPNNPFLISGYYSPEYFCDRQREADMLIDALDNGRDVTLIAPRRIGKTGLIKHTFNLLSQHHPDVVTIYIDIYPTRSFSDFVKLLANTVLGQLDTVPQKAFARMSRFLKSCRPTFSFDEFTGVPKVSIEIVPSSEESTLREIFDYIKSSGKRCCIAIDEFQQISEYAEKGVEALLRSYIQFIPNVNFIFAGSKQHMMQEMFLSAKRPFYQSTQMLTLGKIPEKEYYEFAAPFFAGQNRSLDEDVFKILYERFDGHTWYMQVILNRIYSYKGNIDKSMIDYAVGEVVTESTYVYEGLMAAYPLNCIKLLKAIASENCVAEINSGDFIARHHLKAASSVNSALKKLVDNELVYRSADGYIVYDRFMSIWLRQQMF